MESAGRKRAREAEGAVAAVGNGGEQRRRRRNRFAPVDEAPPPATSGPASAAAPPPPAQAAPGDEMADLARILAEARAKAVQAAQRQTAVPG
ncbi:unnamed protein product, partial [Ectocarpus sp. 8 AP-2014]